MTRFPVGRRTDGPQPSYFCVLNIVVCLFVSLVFVCFLFFPCDSAWSAISDFYDHTYSCFFM